MSRLAQILEVKASEVCQRKVALPQRELEALAVGYQPRGFRDALVNSSHPISLIAEVKKASPSQGLIRSNFDAVELALHYRRAGAEALSVLTDLPFFQGSPEDLRSVRERVDLPIIRKDFMIDPYQLYEAKAWGADCILLIVAALGQGALRDLYQVACGIGLDVLVETHTADELEAAMNLGADMIGVNCRNLATFEVDLVTAETLLPLLPKGCLGVAESAISCREDAERMHAAGASAVLIGTEFARSVNPEKRVAEVMGW